MAARVPFYGRIFHRSFRHRYQLDLVNSVYCCREQCGSTSSEFWKFKERIAEKWWLAQISPLKTRRSYSAEAESGSGPLAVYERQCRLGRLRGGDRMQERVAAALDKLFQNLSKTEKPRSLQEWMLQFVLKPTSRGNSLQGIYIYGGVGRGKTMLMDIFYNEVNSIRKHRVHFHAFMLDVHGRLHGLSKQLNTATEDSVKIVAEQLVDEADLLCLDEVEVTDIADALILRRLFAVLWPLGMVVVGTSNFGPDQLYRNGLNRPLFEPFIKQLKEHCHVYSLDEDQSLDYRRSLSVLDHLYLYPLGYYNDELLDEAFSTLTGGVSGSTTQISVMMGRQLQLLAAPGVARSSFRFLCGGPYGAADYLAIARSFQALMLDSIPWLGDSELENEARRFITLIDILYEANVIFICSAAVPIDELFREKLNLDNKDATELQLQEAEKFGTVVVGEGGSSGRSTLMIGDMEWSATGRMGASLANLHGSSSFTRAASARTVSRLVEMQSTDYLSRAGTFGSLISQGQPECGQTLK